MGSVDASVARPGSLEWAGSATRWPQPRVIAHLARKEVADAIRNRWFLLYALAITGLAVALSRFSLGGDVAAGFSGFGRTAASLVNLVLLMVPLMGLTLGAAALAGERESGTLSLLLSQPVTRAEVLLGKFTGLGLALVASLALGFGAAAALVALEGDAMGVAGYATMAGLAMLLALAMLAVGLLISAVSQRASAAAGAALLVWLALVFLGDLGLMGTALVLQLDTDVLFGLTVLNPLESYKIAAVYSITGSLDLLGPAGNFAVRAYGSDLLPLLTGVLAAWCVIPLIAAHLVFRRRRIA